MVVLRKYNFFLKLNFDNSFLYILYEFDRKIFDQFSQKSHFGRATLSYFLLAEGLHFLIIVFSCYHYQNTSSYIEITL